MIMKFNGKSAQVAAEAWIAGSADVIGDLILGEDSSIWFSVVVRADINKITIGKRCSVQDGSVIHVDKDFPTTLGDDVTVGHKVTLHGCTIGDGCLIGMGAIVLDGAEIGAGSIVAAGSVVTPGKKFPAGSMIMGTPAKVVKKLTEEEQQNFILHARKYVGYKNSYLEMEKR
ncbi:MAG: gamma carbonic anhydrase family protein [Candidatus Cloacimonetes bacterium]|nr:gamma carbonic anhydrase family protein [Candidatus Cloacimonadota bacterium]